MGKRKPSRAAALPSPSEILARLDIEAEYEAMGIEYTGALRSNGFRECRSKSKGDDDRKASACINVHSGRYNDSTGDAKEGMSFWDFAVRYGGHADFKAAVAHFGAKVGVATAVGGSSQPPAAPHKPAAGGGPGGKSGSSRTTGTGGSKRKAKRSTANPLDYLEFEEWTPANERLAKLWELKKPGCTVEAVKAFGGLPAMYGKKDANGPKIRVIALPIFDPEKLTNAPPCGWIVWDIKGHEIEVWRGHDVPAEKRKIQVVAGSQPGIVGKFACERMAVGTEATAWKMEGPSDPIAAFAAATPAEREANLFCCNANGAEEDPHKFIPAFRGRSVVGVHDLDSAGETGMEKWVAYVAPTCRAFWRVRLPGEIAPRHGADVRDFIAGRGAFAGDGPKPFSALRDLAIATPVVTPAETAEAYERVTPQHLKDQHAVDAARARATAAPPHTETAGDAPRHTTPARPTSVASAPTAPPASSPSSPHADGSQPESLEAAMVRQAENIVSTIQLTVCGEYENGAIVVFAFHESRRKYFELRDITKLSYETLIQIAGPPILAHVDDGNDAEAGRVSMPQVRRSIAILAGSQRLHDQSFHEAGVWRVVDDRGQPRDELVLVGSREALIYDRDARLFPFYHPHRGGLDLRFGGEPWYDVELLGRWMAAYSPEWAGAVIEESISLFSGWRYAGREAPRIITGLILASWVQSVWAWRPHVALSGKANTGKSMMFDTLSGIFGHLTERSSKSSEAGTRQGIQCSARIPLLDEFEKSVHRAKTLEMIRASSRGDSVRMGTTDQRGKKFVLRHMFWVAATEVGLQKSPDRSRFILIDLEPPRPEDAGKLTLRPAEELRVLGQKMLAIAIRSALPASEMAVRLKVKKFPGIADRVVESYAVVAAILVTALGGNDDDAEGLLALILRGVEKTIVQTNDEDELMQSILRAVVRLPRGEDATVAALIQRGDHEALERVGLAVVANKPGPRMIPTEHNEDEIARGYSLFVDHRDVQIKLLKGTDWDGGQSLDVHLRRIPGAKQTRRNLGSRRVYGVAIPMLCVRKDFMGIGVAEDAIEDA